jgi:hypothetical protein
VLGRHPDDSPPGIGHELVPSAVHQFQQPALPDRGCHHSRVLVEYCGLAPQFFAEFADDASEAGPDRRPGDTALVGERLLQ